MTPEQIEKIDRAWAKVGSAAAQMARIAEDQKNAAWTNRSQDRMDEIMDAYEKAQLAHTEAHRELVAAQREAGLNLGDEYGG